jgi:hypothetical protein
MAHVNVDTVVINKKRTKKNLVGILKPMKKRAWSGSVIQCYGSRIRIRNTATKVKALHSFCLWLPTGLSPACQKKRSRSGSLCVRVPHSCVQIVWSSHIVIFQFHTVKKLVFFKYGIKTKNFVKCQRMSHNAKYQKYVMVSLFCFSYCNYNLTQLTMNVDHLLA